MKIYNDVCELIGSTPTVRLSRFAEKNGLNAEILAKLEYFNPAGSIKDRVALEMLDDAQKSGRLKPGSVIIEPTSGNTGIGLAAVAASKGYRTIIVMPESMSIERRKMMLAYGAEIVLTSAADGMKGSIEKAEELNAQIPDSIIAGQFVNPANPQAHIKTTGPEIWSDTDGKIDAFVSAIGTGGTVSGCGKYLKSKNPDIRIIGVEPSSSPLLSEGKAGSHKIQGIGANFVPEILDREIIDEIITVTDDEAYSFAAEVTKSEGIFIGISSGAAICAAVKLAKRAEFAGKRIVTILPDGGGRYLSTDNFIK
ncbi:MAG: cysteine synthase A [Clostridia bacterium]|nr:cysteine synthase A [Clostridia bacterium]